MTGRRPEEKKLQLVGGECMRGFPMLYVSSTGEHREDGGPMKTIYNTDVCASVANFVHVKARHINILQGR